MGELHGAKEPVTWAGASIELAERPHRPTSALHRSPTERKWMRWAVGASIGLALTLGLVASFVSDDEPEPIPEAAAEIPTAAEEPPPAPAPVPPPEPEKKSKKAKRDSTLAAAKPAASQPVASKPAASKSGASKPSPKPASSPQPKPAPSNPKPSPGPLAPPDDESSGSKAELPDVEGWDDHDAVAGDRDGE